MTKPSVFTVGGTVQANQQGIYIPRQADDELLALCQTSTFAYVLTSRQVGKSSLMIQTATRLKAKGIISIIVDLTQIGKHDITVEQWYVGILIIITDELKQKGYPLTTDIAKWWQARTHLGSTQRLILFFQEVLLAEIKSPVVIFVDEIDTTLGLEFTDDFYTAIRYIYNARATTPLFERLSFVLLGVATPSDLMSDQKRTPFNIGRRVDLEDFTAVELRCLISGLGLPSRREARQVLDWALKWTGGHPYLTQRLCYELANRNRTHWSEADVDQVVAEIFLSDQGQQDNNLRFVLNWLTNRERFSDLAGLLSTYRAIREKLYSVPDEEHSPVVAHLKLSGVVRRTPDKNTLMVRNPIYETVFNQAWINEAEQSLDVADPRELARLRELAEARKRQIEAEHQRAEEQARSAKRLRHRAFFLRVLLIIAVIAVIGAVVSANKARIASRISLVQSLAALSPRADDDELAALLGVEAFTVNREIKGDKQWLVESTLREVLSRPYFSVKLTGHEAGVGCVTFSPDGQTLASASDDGTIRLWNLTNPSVEPLVLGHSEVSVRSVAFSPDRQTLASASDDGTIRLWNLTTPAAEPLVLRGHTAAVLSVAFNPDGQTLASGSTDGTIRLWNSPYSETEPQLLQAGTAGVEPPTIGPNQQLLTTPTVEPQGLPPDRDEPPPIDPDALTGNSLSSGSSGPPSIRVVAFSPDGQTLASASDDGTIRLWNLTNSTPTELRLLSGHTAVVLSVAFSPDGQTLASASDDGTIRLWNLTTPTIEPQVLRHRAVSVRSVAFNPNGQTLASASDDGTIRLWNLTTPTIEPQVLHRHGASVRSVAFSIDGQTLASAGDDWTIRLWDLAVPKAESRILPPNHTAPVLSVAFSPGTSHNTSRQILASGSTNGTIRLWDLTTSPATELPELSGHTAAVLSVAFSPDGQTLASATGDAMIRLWNLTTIPAVERQPLSGHTAAVLSVAFSPDGQTMASSSADGTIRLWNWADPTAKPQILHLDQAEPPAIRSIAFTPDGQTLASASEDGAVQLWDLTTTPVVERQVLPDSAAAVWAVAFSPNGQTLASANDDGTIRLWDLTTTPIAAPQVLHRHAASVSSVAFSPDGQTLASASKDWTIRLWNLTTPTAEPQVLHGHTAEVWAVAFSPDGRTLASVGSDQTTRLWVAQLDTLVELACGQVHRNLSWTEWQQYLSNEPYHRTCSNLPLGEGVPNTVAGQ